MTPEILEAVKQAAFAAGIDGELLRAIVQVESGGNPQSYRYEPAFYRRYIAGRAQFTGMPWYNDPRRISASYGLGQLMYTTALEVGLSPRTPPEALYSVPLNLSLTAKLVRKLSQRYGGDVRDIAAAYNSGRPFASAPAFTRLIHVPKVLRQLGEGGLLPGVLAGGLSQPAIVVTIAAIGLLLLSGGRNGRGGKRV